MADLFGGRFSFVERGTIIQGFPLSAGGGIDLPFSPHPHHAAARHRFICTFILTSRTYAHMKYICTVPYCTNMHAIRYRFGSSSSRGWPTPPLAHSVPELLKHILYPHQLPATSGSGHGHDHGQLPPRTQAATGNRSVFRVSGSELRPLSSVTRCKPTSSMGTIHTPPFPLQHSAAPAQHRIDLLTTLLVVSCSFLPHTFVFFLAFFN
jgi:hypothetical protein